MNFYNYTRDSWHICASTVDSRYSYACTVPNLESHSLPFVISTCHLLGSSHKILSCMLSQLYMHMHTYIVNNTYEMNTFLCFSDAELSSLALPISSSIISVLAMSSIRIHEIIQFWLHSMRSPSFPFSSTLLTSIGSTFASVPPIFSLL